MYTIKMDFNERFLALREIKRTVCQQLAAKFCEIAETSAALGIDHARQAPCMQPDEEPERRDEVTEADLADFLRRTADPAAAGCGAPRGTLDVAAARAGHDAVTGSSTAAPGQAVERVAPTSELEQAAHATLDRRTVWGGGSRVNWRSPSCMSDLHQLGSASPFPSTPTPALSRPAGCSETGADAIKCAPNCRQRGADGCWRRRMP